MLGVGTGMPHLCLIQNNQVARSFALGDGETLLGRDRHCDIQLGFSGISRRHLRLLTRRGDTLVQDLGSRVGTHVNGEPARQCVLQNGDRLMLGEVELRFEADPANDAAIVTDESAGAASVDAATTTHFTAKAEQLRLEKALTHSRQGGMRERLKNWLGL